MATNDEHSLLPAQINKAADRAGDVVRDQIASITEAAQAVANQIEEEAQEASAAKRARSSEAVTKVHAGLIAVEKELDELLRAVSLQANSLKRSIDRFDVRSGPPGDGASKRAQPEPAALSALVPVSEPEPEPPAPEPDPEPEPTEVSQDATDLEAEAQKRVKGKDPADLIALYELATGDRAEEPSEEDDGLDWSVYWTALHEAVVAEAAGHADFPEQVPDDASLSRRERKARAKALDSLREELSGRQAT